MYLGLFNPIQIVARPKLSGVVQHWGVQLPDGTIIHLTADNGIQVTTLEIFAQGQQVVVVRTIPIHMHVEVMRRVKTAIANPTPYHLTAWNCESFANWVAGDKPESKQVIGWILLAAFGVALAAAAR